MIKPTHYLIFSFIWFAIILIISIIPSTSPDTISISRFEMRLDYLLHFVIYLPLGYALMKWALSKRKVRELVYTIIILLIFSMLPETLQYIIPYRTFNPYDLLFNLVGIITGCLIVIIAASVKHNT